MHSNPKGKKGVNRFVVSTVIHRPHIKALCKILSQKCRVFKEQSQAQEQTQKSTAVMLAEVSAQLAQSASQWHTRLLLKLYMCQQMFGADIMNVSHCLYVYSVCSNSLYLQKFLFYCVV